MNVSERGNKMLKVNLEELKGMDLNKFKKVDLAGLIYDLDTLYLGNKRQQTKKEWVKRALNGVGFAKGWLKAELIQIVSRKIEEALSVQNEEAEYIDENLKEFLTWEESSRYTMLDRLRSDCKYYLGNGDRSKEVLWAKDEKKQINLMRGLYNSFKIKPVWLTDEDINQLEKEMTDTEYIKSMSI